ncbi:MAG TPA: hypothetical protein PK092_01610 [Chitinophagaceae bacterium]|nr:hypothetical protein [Chitinophagaceae bacterium]
MNNEVFPKKIQISDVLKKEINSQVSETVAISEKQTNNRKRSFTAYEMWNRQRNSRSATAMIRRWNLN